MRVNAGNDQQSVQLAGSAPGTSDLAPTLTATTLTDIAASFPTSGLGLVGRIVIVIDPTNGIAVEGVIQGNTATVLTVDGWFTPGTDLHPGALPTSADAMYAITRAGAPAPYIAISNNNGAPAATDTTLPGEIVPPAGGGLGRAKGSLSHTIGSTTWSVTNVFTLQAADTPTTVYRAATFCSIVSGSGPMFFEDALATPQALSTIGDALTLTFQVAMS